MINKPTLVYDGECGFCQYWINYWCKLTQGNIDFQPYQAVARDYPKVEASEFAEKIFLFEKDKTSTSAEAASRVLALAGFPIWHWLYKTVPFVAFFSELLYRFIAKHRRGAYFLSRRIWGKERRVVSHNTTSHLFVRGLALIYFFAFVSIGIQIIPLVGSNGVLPVEQFLGAVFEQHQTKAYFYYPTLTWLASDDLFLLTLAMTGALVSILLWIGVLQTLLLTILFMLYLSLVHAGQLFMHYQWDLFLLEVGFLAVFLSSKSALIVWLFRWLLFRFIFFSGAVKALSGDETWTNLSALQFHFFTQPLPTPLAWWFHQLPEIIHKLACGYVFFVELFVPFLIFVSRRWRVFAAAQIILFQFFIIITGNYNFFNLLTIVLCLFLFDDGHVAWLKSKFKKSASMAIQPVQGVTVKSSLVAGTVFISMLFLSILMHAGQQAGILSEIRTLSSQLGIVNPYGLFAKMTTKRPELIIEGSVDGETWLQYDLPYKPDAQADALSWNIPHQPRLDWQLWYAALGKPEDNLWLLTLINRLLEAEPSVLRLFANDPFDGQRPLSVRVRIVDYEFTSREGSQIQGDTWIQLAEDIYIPALTLK